MKKDIDDIEDIKLMVNSFYEGIRKDDLLGPIFEERIKDRWSIHLEKMCSFWQTILFDEHTYSGAPFPPHISMNLTVIHFNMWVRIFNKTIDDLFEGPVTEEAKKRAALMASIFSSKLNFLRKHI